MNYWDTLQVGIYMLIIISIGFVLGKMKLFTDNQVQKMNKYVFQVNFIPLMARAIMAKKLRELDFKPLAVSSLTGISMYLIFSLLFLFPMKNKLGTYLSVILPANNINYVVGGIPIFKEIFSAEEVSIISILTLANDLLVVPIYLVMADINKMREEEKNRESLENDKEIVADNRIEMNDDEVAGNANFRTDDEKDNKDSKKLTDGNLNGNDRKSKRKCDMNFRLVLMIVFRVLKSPVIIGNVVGFIYVATGLPIPLFLQKLFQFMGDIVLPFSLISIGLFLSGHSLIACSWWRFLLMAVGRHIISPLMSTTFTYLLGFKGRVARQCCLMSGLSTAVSCYLIACDAGTGQGEASTMIFWSNIFAVPSIIAWIAVLDKLHIFVG